MRLLLDTHVAVWSVASSHRLPPHIIEMLASPDNDVFVSVVSLLEIALKNTAPNRDPMPFSASVARFRFTEFRYDWLALELSHIVAIEAFHLAGGDPHDRLLIAQARVADLQFVTHDKSVADRLGSAIYF